MRGRSRDLPMVGGPESLGDRDPDQPGSGRRPYELGPLEPLTGCAPLVRRGLGILPWWGPALSASVVLLEAGGRNYRNRPPSSLRCRTLRPLPAHRDDFPSSSGTSGLTRSGGVRQVPPIRIREELTCTSP